MGKLTIKLQGGLGNQLFQIFFAISKAKQFGLDFYLPKVYWLTPVEDSNNSNNSNNANNITRRHTYYDLFPTVRTLEKMDMDDLEKDAEIIEEKDFTFSELNLNPNKNYVLKGYYQSYKYITVDVYDYLKLPKLTTPLGETVAVHIRRGDYLLKSDFHTNLSSNTEYYTIASNIIKTKVNNPEFIIFSDDVEWCKKNMLWLSNIFVSHGEVMELAMMSMCKHHIIANSSYSWWGAYLSRENGITIYPERWFEKWVDTKDMCPNTWEKCRVRYNVHIMGTYHHKNLGALRKCIENIGWTYSSFDKADIVFSADKYIDIQNYPTKKFILGPHMSVFPKDCPKFNNIHNNSVMIHPSQQCIDVWKSMGWEDNIVVYPFGVDTDKFCPRDNSAGNTPKENVFIYLKRRDPKEHMFLFNFLTEKKVKFQNIVYGSYNENDYLNFLKTCKYGVWLGSHESQGFALQEALSCNVPLLVWSTEYMDQEYNSGYKVESKMISIPYWDERCGEYFYKQEDLENTYNKFISKLNDYKPREYILENLDMKCATNRLKELVNKIGERQPTQSFVKNPIVSIILPTYNRFENLIHALTSVKNQSYPHIQLIIINDGSTDPRYYSEEFISLLPPNTKLLHNKKPKPTTGCAANARNIGMSRATGDYIAFLDDDDYWLPNKLECQLAAMRKTSCDMSCTEGYIGNGLYDPRKTYPLYIQEYHKNILQQKNLLNLPEIWGKKLLQRHNNCICSSVIIKSNIIKKIGNMPLIRVGEDFIYWLSALDHTNCVFLNKPYVYYDNSHAGGSQY